MSIGTWFAARPGSGGRLLLGALLVLVVAGAAAFDPAAVPSPFARELTTAAAAASLAHDRDLLWEAADRERFAALRPGAADQVRVRPTARGGALIDVPLPYPLAVAPLVAGAPGRGPLVLNALLLAVAALATARSLGRRMGAAAPWLVILFLFASVTPRHVLLVQEDLLLVAAVAGGLALALGAGAPRPGRLPDVYPGDAGPSRRMARCLGAGLLLAVPAAYHPLYLLLVPPAAVLVRRPGRRPARGALLAGVGLGLAGFAAATHAATGSVAPSQGWRLGGVAELFSGTAIDPSLLAWNGLYLVAGRHLGALPYLLPVVLALAGWRAGRRRWSLVLAAAAGAVGFLLLDPFDFAGGPGALGNRRLLPFYAALWLVPTAAPGRFLRLAVAALAVLTLGGAWTRPLAHPAGIDGRYRGVSPPVREWLPPELSQRSLPGVEELAWDGLHLRLLGSGLWSAGGPTELRLLGSAEAELVVTSRRPLSWLRLDLGPGAGDRIAVESGGEARLVLRPDGGTTLLFTPPHPRARHPVWWSREPHSLHLVRVRLEDASAGPVRLAVAGGGG